MLKPTHLSLFAISRANGQPIAGAPFYAEVVAPIVIDEPPAEVDHRFDDFISRELAQVDSLCSNDEACRKRVMAAIQEALSRLLTGGARDGLARNSNTARRFIQETIRRVQQAGDGSLKNVADKALRDAIDKAVRDAATGNQLALAPQTASPAEKAKTAYPLGILATNHAGYLSFDLTRLSADVYDSLVKALDVRRGNSNVTLDVSIWFYALAREDLRFDALEQGRFSEDAIVAKLELEEMQLPPIAKAVGYLSMQNPSLTDWRLSPASFAANPSALIGDEEGCETLLPAHVALQEFFFYQVVRLNDPLLQSNIPNNLNDKIKLGVVHEYRLAWYALGHSLGQILYSLPLAPGESVNLAVIDWTRRDDAQRAEHTTVDEQLVHNEHRDRAITETVSAAVDEYQHGSSFMGGLAGSGGASAGSSSGVGLAAGVAGSLGGSTASSSGSRNVAATTVQKLSDNISQASASKRELQSTVVVHSVQAEKEAIETRTVVNYNHSHALTILYYEVLRHFRIVTEFVRLRPAVLVKIRTDWFDDKKPEDKKPGEPDVEQNILENRAALEAALLDPQYGEGFNALQRIAHRKQLGVVLSPPPPPPPPFPAPPYLPSSPSDRQFIYYTFAMTTGAYFSSGDQHIDIRAGLLGLNQVRLYNPAHYNTNDSKFWNLNPPGSLRHQDETNTFVATNPPNPSPDVRWNQVTGIIIDIDPQGSNSQISFRHIKVTAQDVNGVDTVLVDQNYDDGPLAGPLTITQPTSIILPVKQPDPLPLPPPRPADEVEDDVKKAELLAHLRYHAAYYSRAILLKQDAANRARELDNIDVGDGSSILDRVENRPLEIIGDYLAYPCTDTIWERAILNCLKDQAEADPPPDERLVTLPTRGVFAEAKLGHCNASEEIDNTRFWDWQQSPIPHLAPEIAPVTPVTPQPQQPNLAPTPFPQSLINIVNPPAAPDPTGLAGAFNVLATPNIFRDMSGRAEVADLLKKLSDNSVSIAQAANQARSIQAKYGENLLNTPTGGVPTTNALPPRSTPQQGPPSSTPQQASPAANEERARIDNAEKKLQVAKDHLTPSQQNEVRKAVTKDLSTTPITWTVTLISNWVGETILQPMVATYSGSVSTSEGENLLVKPVEFYEHRSQAQWNVELDKTPLSLTIVVSDIVPFTGDFTVAVPGTTVEGLTLKEKTYNVPLRGTGSTLTGELQANANIIQADEKNPNLAFNGIGKIGKKEIEVTVEVNSSVDISDELVKAFQADGTVEEIVKLGISSTLKAAVKTTLGGKAAIKGTFEILYLVGYDLNQLVKPK